MVVAWLPDGVAWQPYGPFARGRAVDWSKLCYSRVLRIDERTTSFWICGFLIITKFETTPSASFAVYLAV